MELVVATLASIRPGQDIDSITHMRLVYDTLRNAPGVIASNLYHHQGDKPYYLILTTWDDDTSWQSAGERHNPQILLRSNMPDLLASPPQQWYMHYLWGYSRPTRQANIATAHLLALPSQQLRRANQECLLHLSQLSVQATLTFAFLAYGVSDTPIATHTSPLAHSQHPEPQTTLFGFFSWSSEEERTQFFQHPQMQTLGATLRTWGTLHTLPLELL